MTGRVEYTGVLHPLAEPVFTTWPDGKVTASMAISSSVMLKFDTPREIKQLATALLSVHDGLEDAQRAAAEHAPVNYAAGMEQARQREATRLAQQRAQAGYGS